MFYHLVSLQADSLYFTSMDGEDNKIVEGEVVDQTTTSVASGSGAADDLITITNLIQSYIGNLDRAQEEMKAHKQMLLDSFANDPTFREHEEKVKDAMKIKNATKQQILKQPTLKELAEKVKEMSQGVKDMREALSSYLQEYAKITGSREFEDAEGELREIIYTAKLVKTASKKDR